MKRDMDLVRAILLIIEDEGSPALSQVPEVDGYREPTVIEHVRLLVDGGYIDAIDAGTMSGPDYLNLRITWAGHDFVEKVRDPEIWKVTKQGASKLGSWSVGLLGELAVGYIKAKANQLGLPLQ